MILTELRKLLEPRQRVASEHHAIFHGQRPNLIRVGKDKVVLSRLRRLPLQAVLRNNDAELITIIEHVHVRRVIEIICVGGCTKKELSCRLEKRVEALLALLLRRSERAEAGQQPGG